MRKKPRKTGLDTFFGGHELDSPVSNSGRLAGIMRKLAERHRWPWQVELVPDPDAILIQAKTPIVTADSGVLDRCGTWFNLARLVVERHVPSARVVDFLNP